MRLRGLKLLNQSVKGEKILSAEKKWANWIFKVVKVVFVVVVLCKTRQTDYKLVWKVILLFLVGVVV